MFHDSYLSRPAKERLFFALLPPQRLAFSIVAWAEQALGDGWHMQRADRLHVTLGITDDFDHLPFDLLERVLKAGETVAAAPVQIELDQLVISNRSAALRPSRTNPGLKALQQAIAQAMKSLGAPQRDGWHFSPHMTLGYRDSRPSQRPVEARQWLAEEFVLIRSLVGRTKHLPLGRWRLNAVPPAQYELF